MRTLKERLLREMKKQSRLNYKYMGKKTFTGINIQFPISTLILEGTKTVETRVYPLPERLIGKELAIVETPGPTGKFKSRIVGIIVFGQSNRYKSAKDFYLDHGRHRVTKDSPWAWDAKKKKWAWPIIKVVKFKKEIPLTKRPGIIYSKDLEVTAL